MFKKESRRGRNHHAWRPAYDLTVGGEEGATFVPWYRTCFARHMTARADSWQDGWMILETGFRDWKGGAGLIILQ